MGSLREKYLCRRPYEFSELYEDKHYLCCPSWLPVDIKQSDNALLDFHSNKSQEIRQSIEDSSYKYCDNKLCPYLNSLDNGYVDKSVFIDKNSSEAEKLIQNPLMSIVNLAYDMSCNLACPSCRSVFINYKEDDRLKTNVELDKFIDYSSEEVRTLILCGSADPFFSKTYLNFMVNFDESKFPNLRYIHLHTNGVLWTEQVWKKISKIHKYVKSFEISIDAATKDTYENKVRLGGNWEKLLNNLKFIETIESIPRMRFSFVVQKNNYKEMLDFYKLIKSIFYKQKRKLEILFIGITDWGSLSKEEFQNQEIHNPTHPEHKEFLKELEKIVNLNIEHNFHHLLTRQKTVI